jgi:hypothetical protein
MKAAPAAIAARGSRAVRGHQESVGGPNPMTFRRRLPNTKQPSTQRTRILAFWIRGVGHPVHVL